MSQSRRQFIKNCGAVAPGVLATSQLSAHTFEKDRFTRIATEETITTDNIYDATIEYIKSGAKDEAGLSLPPKNSGIIQALSDLGQDRIDDMDTAGIAVQLLSLWSPGVQIFNPAQGTELAIDTNNQLADAIKKYPGRYAGLVTVATQDPEAAAMEIDRGMGTLGLNGVIINSHTKAEYLDNKKYWSIFEAAQARDAAIYLHPRKPSNKMYEPFSQYSMDAPMWGFHADASLHAVRLLLSGVFDEFPDLKVVLGHMGEGLPFWIQRLDDIDSRDKVATIKRSPSDYFLDNCVITTSAMFWDPILMLSMQVVGADRIMFGVDYPFASSQRGAEWLDTAPITGDDKKKIYELNARRVFHI